MIKYIKSLIPVPVKYIPWYIFKSPQRKNGFFKSIYEELIGLFIWLAHILFSGYKRDLRPVSICTGIKNRTFNYLEYVLPSILRMQHQELIELSIYDCGSEDVDALEQKIRDKWKGKLIFVSEPQPFTRSISFNKAIDQCSNDLFFATDADMGLPGNLVYLCNKYVTSNTVWFPVFFTFFEKRPEIISKQNGEWLPSSKGMFASTKYQFEKTGKFNILYKQWGWEDTDLWISYFTAGIVPLRNKCRELIHHWHPSLAIKTEEPEHLKKYKLI